jgi:predicted dehydrogenase
VAKKLKVGIIGVGTIGNVHADAYKATGEAEIAAICDIDEAKLKRVGDRLGVSNRLTSWRELIAQDIDAVSVCVPNVLHHDFATGALKAGKNVLLEKPMAMNAAQAASICKTAAKAKGVIQIGMVNRQAPAAQTLRDWVKAGRLGEIYHINVKLIRRRGIPGMGGWFTTKAKSGGGPMIDIGVHAFDLGMFVSGLWNVTSVSAKVYAKFGPAMRDYKYVGMWAGPPNFNGKFDVEDYSCGFARFGKKATMTFDISWAANAREECYVDVLGDKGGARIFDGSPLTILSEQEGRLVDIMPKYSDKVNAFEMEMRKFIAACRREAKPAATAEQGLAVMKLIDAIYLSDRKSVV